jgi:hypothetical protein
VAAPQKIDNAYIVARYAASDGYVAYRWQHSSEDGKTYLRMQATGSGALLHLRLMLPPETKEVSAVRLNAQPVPFQIDTIGTSQYVTLDTPADVVQVEVEIRR